MPPLLRKGLAALLLGFGLMIPMPPVSADDASNCPPGQPAGRPPGQPPNAPPGQPTGRPPQYPPGECNLRLSRASAARGESVQVSGSGFQSGEQVVIRLGGRIAGGAAAAGDGAFTAALVVPGDADLGPTVVLATGARREQSAVLEVTASAAGAGSGVQDTSGSLPRTGGELAPTAAAGLGLVLAGILAVVGARRRRPQPC